MRKSVEVERSLVVLWCTRRSQRSITPDRRAPRDTAPRTLSHTRVSTSATSASWPGAVVRTKPS